MAGKEFNEFFDGYLSAMLEMAVDEEYKDIREELGYSIADFQKSSLKLLRSAIKQFITTNDEPFSWLMCSDWNGLGCEMYFSSLGNDCELLWLNEDLTEELAEQLNKLAGEIPKFFVEITKNKKKLKLKKID